MTTATSYIGKPTDRVDGRVKVTGEAKYAGEYNIINLVYGFVISSTAAKGKISRIDTEAALALEGVIQVFTHKNRPHPTGPDRSYKDDIAPPGQPFRPLYDENIRYSAQPVALVVAETFELARYAASLVRVEYSMEPHETDLNAKRDKGRKPEERELIPPPHDPRGNPGKAFAAAAVQHEAEYRQPLEHHNPTETHASTVVYEADGALTVYTKTQGVQNCQRYICSVFDLPSEKVRVLSPFVGGAFGSGLRPQYQLFFAVMAALALKRSVRVSLTRQQMFTFGHRPVTIQKVSLGASAGGALEAVLHDALTETSSYENYSEDIVNWSGLLYQCDNVQLGHKVVQMDTATPTDMRAPGATTGLWALESALDELSYKLKIDPIELRLKNYAERDQNEDKPFSSKELRACYRQGAEAFGWARRKPEPRSMKEGATLIGWGMATGMWEALYSTSSAKAVLTADGRLEVSSATADIGTGTYTIMTQIAAETLGLPMSSVTFKLGDSSLPKSFVEGGSMTAASCGSAVMEVCDAVRKRLFRLAQDMDGSPFAGKRLEDVTFAEGRIVLNSDDAQAISITEPMRHGRISVIEEETDSELTFAQQSQRQAEYTRNTHSAVFAEVKVDEELGTVRVTRFVSAIAGGRILNPKTARSQIIGGVVWGIGMALEEESVIDQNFGRIMNHNLAEYHVPVNADVPDIEVIFVEEHDAIVNPLGVKGLGEIGITGVAAAIANAVFHATGKRIRDLPISLDKLL